MPDSGLGTEILRTKRTMIIGSTYRLTVGEIHIPVRVFIKHQRIDPQPFLVIREATHKEYLEQHPEDANCWLAPYQYEVTTD